jgi:hypothetical protein
MHGTKNIKFELWFPYANYHHTGVPYLIIIMGMNNRPVGGIDTLSAHTYNKTKVS